MDKIRRFICVCVPDSICNLSCKYCYLRWCDRKKPIFEKFIADEDTFKRALSRRRLGGACMFNFTSDGETLLNLRIIDYAAALIKEGHYVEIVTNATYKPAFDKLCSLSRECLSHLMLKCSFHYLELERLNLTDVFCENVNAAWDAGASITVEMVPTDDLLPYRKKIYDLCMRRFGAPCHLTVPRNPAYPDRLPLLSGLPHDDFMHAWEMFDSELFRYKMRELETRPRGFCYAGDWMCCLNPSTGILSQCYFGYRRVNIFSNVESPIDFMALGWHCRQPYCFNAHAWLTFGCIPGHSAPFYDQVRNRECQDGREWLQPDIKAFFHQKFAEGNEQYSAIRRVWVWANMESRRLLFLPLRLAVCVLRKTLPANAFNRLKRFLLSIHF